MQGGDKNRQEFYAALDCRANMTLAKLANRFAKRYKGYKRLLRHR